MNRAVSISTRGSDSDSDYSSSSAASGGSSPARLKDPPPSDRSANPNKNRPNGGIRHRRRGAASSAGPPLRPGGGGGGAARGAGAGARGENRTAQAADRLQEFPRDQRPQGRGRGLSAADPNRPPPGPGDAGPGQQPRGCLPGTTRAARRGNGRRRKKSPTMEQLQERLANEISWQDQFLHSLDAGSGSGTDDGTYEYRPPRSPSYYRNALERIAPADRRPSDLGRRLDQRARNQQQARRWQDPEDRNRRRARDRGSDEDDEAATGRDGRAQQQRQQRQQPQPGELG